MEHRPPRRTVTWFPSTSHSRQARGGGPAEVTRNCVDQGGEPLSNVLGYRAGMAWSDDPVSELYGLPLASFTGERNALAARLKKSGDAEAAAEVKALAKPSISAWAVNQLAREAGPALQSMLEAGDRARAAQSKALAGGSADDLRARLDDLRDALLELRARAAKILEDGGHAAGDDTLERVTTTLRTASQAPEAAELVLEGRLAEDLDPLGITVLNAGPRLVITAPRGRRAAAGQRAAESAGGAKEARAESVRERLKRIAEEAHAGKRAPAPATARRQAAAVAAPAAKASAKARSTAQARAHAQAKAREAREQARRERVEDARRRREEERAERERRRKAEEQAAKLRAALHQAEADDARAKRAVEAAEEALQSARQALSLAKDEREETLSAARQARAELERVDT